MMKIGYFFGSFDPFHDAHAEIVKRSLEIVDYVFITPAYQNPMKPNYLYSTEERVEIIKDKMNIKNNLNINYGISEIDITNKYVHTIDTLEDILFGANLIGYETFYIIGSDSFNEIPKWYKGNEILALDKVKFIIFNRNNIEINQREKRFGDIIIDDFDMKISSTEIKQKENGRKILCNSRCDE